MQTLQVRWERVVSALVGEEERGPAERVEPEVRARDLGEPVEALAHVAGLEGDVDFEVAVEGEHWRPSGLGI